MIGRDLGIVVLYTAAMAAWVYGALNADGGLNRLDDNDPMIYGSLAVLGLAHLLAGFSLGRVWAVVLPAILVAVAVPAGDFPTSRPEYPIWFGLALASPIFVVATGVGVAARRLTGARSPADSA